MSHSVDNKYSHLYNYSKKNCNYIKQHKIMYACCYSVKYSECVTVSEL